LEFMILGLIFIDISLKKTPFLRYNYKTNV